MLPTQQAMDNSRQADIYSALALFVPLGETLEIRAFSGPPRSGPSHYAWFTNPTDAAAYAAGLPRKVHSVYFTPNRQDPATPTKKDGTKGNTTTADKDITQRRWLLVDVDPIGTRPKGEPSTEEEKENAWAAASAIHGQLTDAGFTSLIVADSGNGWHIMAPIDLPNTPETTETIKKLLAALGRQHGTELIDIDPSICNAARIWKLYGTWARKGTATAERPHRLAGFHPAFPLPTAEEVEASRPGNNAALADFGRASTTPAKRKQKQPKHTATAENELDVLSPPLFVMPGKTQEGGRNTAAFKMACELTRRGFRGTELEASMDEWNRETCDPPLDRDELMKAVGNGERRALEDLTTPKKDPTSTRYELWVKGDEQTMRRQVMAVLGTDERLFRQDGMLVTPKEQHDVGGTVLAAACPNFVRALIVERFWLRKKDSEGREKDANCPAWLPSVLVGAATDAELVPCREISGVLSGPALDGTGDVCNTNGYARVNGRGWYCAGHVAGLEEAMPSSPTLEDARQAERRIWDVVQYFPWADDYGYPMWLAALLAQVCRPLFDCCPATLITATAPGSGKSYLATIIGIIAHGREPGMMPWPKHREAADTDNELRKRIMGLAATGSTLAVFDNLEAGCAFDSDAMNAAVTSTLLADRTLGVNGAGSIQTRRIWAQFIATGNAVVPAGDMSDRTLFIRLQSNEPNRRELPPETFGEIGDALDYTRTRRVELLAACLTMARAFMAAGTPRQHGKPWNTFNAFHDLILGIVRWTTDIDPIAQRLAGVRLTDPVTTALRQLATNWATVFSSTPVSARMIAVMVNADPCGEEYAALGEALQALGAGRAGQKLSPHSIGNTLTKYKDRIFETENGFTAIRFTYDKHTKTNAWTVSLTGS